MAIPISVNGRTVFVRNIDEALNFNYQEAIANNSGMEINNPFFDMDFNNDAEYEELIQIEVLVLESIEGFEEIELDEDISDI